MTTILEGATVLSASEITRAGVASSLVSPGTYGNRVICDDGRVFLRVKNTNAASRTVTVYATRTLDGLDVADLTVVVPALTGEVLIGPITGHFLQPGSMEFVFVLSATTGVTVQAFHLSLPTPFESIA